MKKKKKKKTFDAEAVLGESSPVDNTEGDKENVDSVPANSSGFDGKHF